MKEDSYKIIAAPSEGIYKDKGSKFFAFAFPVTSEEQVKIILLEIKKKFHDARHHCYAYKFGLDDDKFRVNDDGEPSGTAGKPIYGQILSNEISDVLIIVVRYFGGVLLGTGGLINAYRSAAADCVSNAKIEQKILKRSMNIHFSYELMSIVMRIVKEENLDVLKQDYTEKCILIVDVRLNDYERVLQRYAVVYGVEIQDHEL